jgi:hypothetical protein
MIGQRGAMGPNINKYNLIEVTIGLAEAMKEGGVIRCFFDEPMEWLDLHCG